ncbi:MAG: hypothetical protein ACREIC_04980 [Limisphaerales bacterium]
MTRTVENLLTWAPLGAGLALMLSDHKRLGLAVVSVSATTVAWRHPRATRRALQAVPRTLGEAGKSVGKAGRDAGREVGRSLRWLAS